MDHMAMLPVIYGYARVSRADDDAKNLETQLWILAGHGIREDLIFSDVASGRTVNRTGLFSVNYFCRRIVSPKSLLYESGCLN